MDPTSVPPLPPPSSSPSPSLPSSASSSSSPPGSFFSSLTSNPLFAGGLGIAGLGIGAAVVRTSLLRGLLMAQKYFTVSLEVQSKDRSYQWMLYWINRHTRGRTQHLGVETTFTQAPGSGQIVTSFEFVPSTGSHWFWYKKSFINVRREREKSMMDLASGTPFETVTLTSLGRSRQVFSDILNEAREMALKKSAGKTLLFTAWGTEWKQFGAGRNKRPLESVLLPAGLGESLFNDVQEFTRSQQWYLDRGIPYRRGYLLHGPPGCGKSSFIFALAGSLSYNIAILNLNDKGLTDDRLNVLLSVVPPRTIILLEDVDAAFSADREQKNQYSVTFSGLLNALDGVASTEERVIFMTTNHLNRLDRALIRPGRVDVKLLVGHATHSQIRGMFLRFFPNCHDDADRFLSLVQKGVQSRSKQGLSTDLSMAELQGYFLVHKHSMATAMAHAEEIHDAQKVMQVAASFVSSLQAPPGDGVSTTEGAECITAVPDAPVNAAVLEDIKRQIEATRESEEKK